MKVNPVLLWIAGTIAACSTIITAWVQIGGPIPASQGYVLQGDDEVKKQVTRGLKKVEVDGKRQTEESAKWGRKIYTQELNNLLVHSPPTNLEQRQIWNEQIDHAKKWKKFYSDKEIELRKK